MRLTKTVGQYFLGTGAIDELPRLLAEQRHGDTAGSTLFLLDHYFSRDAAKTIVDSLPMQPQDQLIFVDTTDEPTTELVDSLVTQAKQLDDVVAVVGMGGGATMDCAKAVSNLLANGGAAADYQGWDLVPKPGVFKIGIPTLSGTGAEASRTCVMMNKAKNLKLGMNSDYTVFDRLILDPALTATVPRDQYFYTGMDTYIHCVESLAGRYRHALADAFSEQSLKMCRDIFLHGDMMETKKREQLMVASFLGGSAIGNSYVGLVHPFSAGLSMVLHTHHCIGNCIALNALGDYYPRETEEFRRMLDLQGISLPKGVCANLDEAGMRSLYEATVIHEKPLANALGPDFKSELTFDRVAELFSRM